MLMRLCCCTLSQVSVSEDDAMFETIEHFGSVVVFRQLTMTSRIGD